MVDAVAKVIGLLGYATKTEGIGGLIKSRVTDFRVEEIDQIGRLRRVEVHRLVQARGL